MSLWIFHCYLANQCNFELISYKVNAPQERIAMQVAIAKEHHKTLFLFFFAVVELRIQSANKIQLIQTATIMDIVPANINKIFKIMYHLFDFCFYEKQRFLLYLLFSIYS